MTVAIKPFTINDIESFVEFRHLASKESKFLNDSNIEKATEIQKEYSEGNKKAYLLKEKNLVVGQLFLVYHPATNVVGLALISVLESYQGRGYARNLLTLVDAYAEDKKAKYVELYVDKENSRAIKLYEKFGYTKLKNHGKNRMLYVKYPDSKPSNKFKLNVVFRW